MKKLFTAVCCLFICHSISAQDAAVIKAIEAEGRVLYRLEAAAWYGTDIFLQEFGAAKERLKGYFAYVDKNVTKALFFSKGTPAKVLGTVSFDTSFNVSTALRDSVERNFTDHEKDIYQLREAALAIVQKDTTFKLYQNTNLNLIPLVGENQKKVYMLTGPQASGVVIFGNDYLLTFDRNNNLQNVKTLHRNIIPVEARDAEKKIVATMHSHRPETGAYITATDICTLLLYQKFTDWEQHIVMSDEYVSIWNTAKSNLVVLTRKAWDKVYKKNDASEN